MSGVRRTPRWAASAWKTTAAGTTIVLCPAAAARQPKSMSLPNTASCSSKPAEVLEHGAAHEHAGGVDGEHGAHVVVLALVVLAPLEARLPPAGAGDRHADLEQAAQRGPLAQLGAEHVGLGVGLGRGQQLGQRVGRRVGVVVEDPDPVHVLDALQAQAYGGREGRRRRSAHDGVGAEGRLEQVRRGVLAAGVDGDDASRPRALALEAGDHRGQPPGAVMADDERDDALSRGRIHGGSR